MDQPAAGAEPLTKTAPVMKPRRRARSAPAAPTSATTCEAIRRHDLTFGIGPAGTGKTYLAVACAVEALQRERVRRIVLVRPAVEAGERLGFLPGDMAQKVDPYLRPMYDALYDMMGFERVARADRAQRHRGGAAGLHARPHAERPFIILDEAQNTTLEQMKMFLTRIGFGSQAVVTGDVTQIDLPRGQLSGLRHVIEVLQGVEGIGFTLLRRARRRAPSAGAAHRRRPTSALRRRRESATDDRARRLRRSACVVDVARSRRGRRAPARALRRAGRGCGAAAAARRGASSRCAWSARPRAGGSTAAVAARTSRPMCCLLPSRDAPPPAAGDAALLGDLVICAPVVRARGARAGQAAARALGAPGGARRAAPARLRPRARRATRSAWSGARSRCCARSGFPNPYRLTAAPDRHDDDPRTPQRQLAAQRLRQRVAASREDREDLIEHAARRARARPDRRRRAGDARGRARRRRHAGARHHGAARADGRACERDDPPEQILPTVIESGHSRFPVHRRRSRRGRRHPARQGPAALFRRGASDELRYPRLHAPGDVRAGEQARQRAAEGVPRAAATTWPSSWTNTAASPAW